MLQGLKEALNSNSSGAEEGPQPKLLLTKKVRVNGLMQGDVLKVKYLVPEWLEGRMDKLWVGIYQQKGGAIAVGIDFIRLEEREGFLKFDTSALKSGRAYRAELREGEVWPLITTHAASSYFQVLGDADDVIYMETGEVPPRPAKTSGIHQKLPEGTCADCKYKNPDGTYLYCKRCGMPNANPKVKTTTPTKHFQSAVVSKAKSSKAAPPKMQKSKSSPKLVGFDTSPRPSLGGHGGHIPKSSPKKSCLKVRKSQHSQKVDVGEIVSALCELDMEWRDARVIGLADTHVAVMFDDMMWEQPNTPFENVKSKKAKPKQRAHSSPPKQTSTVQLEINQIMQDTAFKYPDEDPNFWKRMQSESRKIAMSRGTRTVTEMQEEEKYLKQIEEMTKRNSLDEELSALLNLKAAPPSEKPPISTPAPGRGPAAYGASSNNQGYNNHYNGGGGFAGYDGFAGYSKGGEGGRAPPGFAPPPPATDHDQGYAPQEYAPPPPNRGYSQGYAPQEYAPPPPNRGYSQGYAPQEYAPPPPNRGYNQGYAPPPSNRGHNQGHAPVSPRSGGGGAGAGRRPPPPSTIPDAPRNFTGLGVGKMAKKFTAVQVGQLSVKKGAVVAILAQPAPRWFMCSFGNEVGLVPAKLIVNFVPNTNGSLPMMVSPGANITKANPRAPPPLTRSHSYGGPSSTFQAPVSQFGTRMSPPPQQGLSKKEKKAAKKAVKQQHQMQMQIQQQQQMQLQMQQMQLQQMRGGGPQSPHRIPPQNQYTAMSATNMTRRSRRPPPPGGGPR